MNENPICSAEDSLYTHYEKCSKSRINRRCIDGSITGCGNCVGYCQFKGHPGFLTQKLREEHDCINKQCYYYLPKPKRSRCEKNVDISAALLSLAKQGVGGEDDLCFINAWQREASWVIGYITVFGQYDFSDLEQKIGKECGVSVIMQRLDYSFERCVELICSRC